MPESRIRSVRELRRGVWEVDIVDASRKRLRRRFRAESADGARAAALASLPGPKACTLAEALDRYFEILTAKGAARKTVANYRKECRALGAIAGCAVDSISPAAAAAALESAESRGVSRVRCYRLKTICAAAGRHALAEGLCASNPFSEVPFDVPRPPRKKRPIPPAGLKAAQALATCGSGHSAAAIGLALGCGLKPGEMAIGLKIPYVEGQKAVFTKFDRRKEVDLSTVCATVGKFGEDYRVAIGSCAPPPIRLPKTEALLKGKKLTPELIGEAAELAGSEVSPISDVRASAEYRISLVKVAVRRSLAELSV